MSTRRSTRATSRSSRAVSPAPSNTTTTTGRTRRRAGNEPLPAVGLRTSTAYGTNTTPKAPKTGGPVVSDQIETVLQGLLATTKTQDETARAQTPREETPPSADRSFGLESAIFHGARFESSQPSTPPRSPSYTKSPEPPTAPTGVAAHVAPKDAPEIQALQKLARQRLTGAGVAEPGSFSRTVGSIKLFFKAIGSFMSELMRSIFSIDVLPYITVALMAFVIYQGMSSGFDLKESISDYFPAPTYNSSGDHFFTPKDAHTLNKRIGDLEKAVESLNKRVSKIEPAALDEMNNTLPEYLAVEKDTYGRLIIPDDFWTALQDKIRADDTILKEQINQPINTGNGKSTVSHKELAKEVEKASKSAWDKYMEHNSKKLQNILNDELTKKFPTLLAKNGIATRDEVLELIRTNWNENAEDLSKAFDHLSMKAGSAMKAIEKLQKNPGTMTKEEVTTIINDVLKKLIPHAQLDALAKANLKSATQSSLARVNHFSLATGAIVDPAISSPTYIFPQSDVWFGKRWMRAAIGNPISKPNPPRAALMRWEEYGDCWCAASTNVLGFGPSLGVITANNIFPDQIVVEHIPSSATLQPGSTPRDMELVAYIGNLDTYNAVKTASEGLFPDEVAELEHPYRYVRIATWTYDASGEIAQSFPVQVDTRALGADANKFIVRAKNNWGGVDEVPFTCLYRIKVHGEVRPVALDI